MSASRATRRGHAPAWWQEGEDPDYRFSLANERTSLAWIRTSLALLAASVAALQFLPEPTSRVAGSVVAACLGLAGGLAAVVACVRWSTNEQAMRQGRRLAYGPVVSVFLTLTVVLVVVAAVVVAFALAW